MVVDKQTGSRVELELELEENDDGREWKPEACFRATDVLHGGRVVDLSKNITRGQLEKHPYKPKMWRVPHYVQVRSSGRKYR